MRRLLLILAPLALAMAQGTDPLRDHLVPPEVIMEHQGELGISDEQREQIKQLVSEAQAKFSQLQWDLRARMDALQEQITENAAVDAVLAQLDQVLEIESQIKRTHLGLLLGLRRVLTKEQFETAMGFRRHRTPRGP